MVSRWVLLQTQNTELDMFLIIPRVNQHNAKRMRIKKNKELVKSLSTIAVIVTWSIAA